MVAYSPRNVAFSKVLYVVPTRDDEGNLIAGAEIVPGVLNGNTAVAQATSGDNTGSVMVIPWLTSVLQLAVLQVPMTSLIAVAMVLLLVLLWLLLQLMALLL
jgi:hypothetical protein